MNGKEKVIGLSQFARDCARVSSLKSNLYMNIFEKDGSGIPVPSNGICWSVSHKPDFVAGVVSKEKVGIDLEQIKDVSDALFERIIDPDEERHFRRQDKQMIFFRAFTAKEAVLKKTTDGIRGLSKAKIKMVIDDENLVVQYSGEKHWVENFYFDGYLASVTKNHLDVHWTLR